MDEKETKKARIEIILVGLRNLAPFHFQPIVNPFLEIDFTSYKPRSGWLTFVSKLNY